jgi:hypothetical protein
LTTVRADFVGPAVSPAPVPAPDFHHRFYSGDANGSSAMLRACFTASLSLR